MGIAHTDFHHRAHGSMVKANRVSAPGQVIRKIGNANMTGRETVQGEITAIGRRTASLRATPGNHARASNAASASAP